jgi:hypothetical protein
MSPDGVPLGVTSQKTYARKAETKTASYKQTVKGRPITEKETFRWVEAVTAAKAVLPDKHVVVVGDRESDIFEVFNQGRSLGVDLLVRTNQNRLLTEAGETVRLFDKARQGNIVTRYETDVPVDHHKTRKAVLTIRGVIHAPAAAQKQKSERGVDQHSANSSKRHGRKSPCGRRADSLAPDHFAVSYDSGGSPRKSYLVYVPLAN